MLWAMTLADIAKRLNQDHDAGAKLPPVIFITDHQAVPDPEKVIAGLAAGSAVIFRDYAHPLRAELGAALVRCCRAGGIRFLVAGDAALAANLAADGLHLPERMMREALPSRAAHPYWLITVSCHDSAAITQAEKLPVDAALIAPIFPTDSHPETYSGQQATLGLHGARDLVKQTILPLYALGGITSDNAPQLIGSGLAGLAAIRGFQACRQ